MKIAIATLADLPIPPVNGGAVENLIEILSSINETGNGDLQIDIYSVYQGRITPDKKYTRYYYYKKHKTPAISIKTIFYKLFKVSLPDKDMKWIIRRINHEDYDAVIVTSIINELELFIQKINARVIWYLHGDPVTVLSTKRINSILNECFAVFAVSKFIHQQIVGINSNVSTFVIHNTSSVQPIRRNEEKTIKNLVKAGMGIPLQSVLLLYVGRILPIKGVLEMVKAFNMIHDNNVYLAIAGSPSNESEKEYFDIIENEANDHVMFCGYIENEKLNMYYCACDAVIIPSICNEAAPLTLIEAQQCNRPVIASNLGGIPEYSLNNVILIEYNSKFEENIFSGIKTVLKRIENGTFERSCQSIFSKESFYMDFTMALQKLCDEEE